MVEGHKIQVAYADDHIAVRKGVVAFIEKIGCITVVIEADHGEDLLKQLKFADRFPDVVILDIHMPHLDGFQTVPLLKEKWPNIKILILTAFETELYLIQMINMGINGYLLKSCHPKEINDAVTNIYKFGSHYSDATEERFFAQVQSGDIKLPHFTDNEMQFLTYCPTDLTYNQIAGKMNTTVKALEGYMSRLCEKLHVRGRIGLAMCAVQFGFVKIDVKKKPKFIIESKK